MDILTNIKLIRRLKAITQLDMAERVGISLNSYSRLENGINDLSYKRLQQIADIFEVTVCEIIQYGEETGKDKEIAELKAKVTKQKNIITAYRSALKEYAKDDMDDILDLAETLITSDYEISIHDEELKKHVKEDMPEEDELEQERLAEHNSKSVKKRKL